MMQRPTSSGRRHAGVTVLALLIGGCSGSNGSSAADDAGAEDSNTSVGRDANGGVGSCSADENCSGDLVCHPYAQFCVTPGTSCSDHSACSFGRYCEIARGICLDGTTGSPCATDANCDGTCTGGFCGCDGVVHDRQLSGGPLDVYLILDRTGSMGRDCDYQPGDPVPVDSKACFATYALSDYLISVTPAVETRLAFQFMSQPDDCDGGPYTTPLVDLTPLPIASDHRLIQEISDETFVGGLGTHIEGALRGLARYTSANVVPGREMIGVLITDGDPRGCEENISRLRDTIADHLASAGIRTFIIGMEGATERNLEQLASAGGAEPHDDWCGGISPPCHYWNVGDGSGDAIASALQAIIQMAVPLPCHFSVADLAPPVGETLDFNRVNVTLTDSGATTTIGRVSRETECPTDQLAWYYDTPAAPTQIHLCPAACSLVSAAADGASVSAVVGCRKTVTLH